jgi:hypothetical protein
MWFFTVCSEMFNRLPICLLEQPFAASLATSYSRAVSACMQKNYIVGAISQRPRRKIYEIRTSEKLKELAERGSMHQESGLGEIDTDLRLAEVVN